MGHRRGRRVTPDGLRELVEGLDLGGPAEPTSMFGSKGYKVNGKTFVMVVKEEVVIKLPAPRVESLADAGVGHRFDPGHGRVMKEWITLTKANQKKTAALVCEAYQFVASQPATSSRSRKATR